MHLLYLCFIDKTTRLEKSYWRIYSKAAVKLAMLVNNVNNVEFDDS